jgi:GGDEF domain-containing protein
MENLAKDKIILNQYESSRIDHRTQIPNEQAFDYDLVEIAKPGIVGIMIDIVGFGNFNNTYNDLRGDELLKKIAQYLFLNSRRSERVFRFSERREDDPDTIIQIGDYGSAYRLHRKGDEFIVILNGGEVDALGFLNRLRREFSDNKSEIFRVGGEVILFYASVVEISVQTTPKEFLYNLSENLVIAKRNAKLGQSRVVTHSNNNYSELNINRNKDESEEDFEKRKNLYRIFQFFPEWKGNFNQK